MNETKQTVFLVDDDPSFLNTMSRWLRAFGYPLESYSSATDFLSLRPIHASGCVVADLQMPGMDGIDLQQELAKSSNPLPIIFLTGHGDIPTSVKAMRFGAEDFLSKTVSKEDLLSAIERAIERNVRERNERKLRSELLSRFEKLTPRENEVLAHVLQGQMNKQIASDLGIDERSVKRHRTNLMNKLEVKSVVILAQIAVEAGIVGENALPSDLHKHN